MSVDFRPCDDCAEGLHDHDPGKCPNKGTAVISTSGNPREQRTACGCKASRTLGVKDPDTQREVSFAG